MIITSQGFGHFTQGINNQDFGIETPRMLLIVDGCSGGKYSEVGTKLFAQIFSRKEECNKVETFENNVKTVFDELIGMMAKYYSSKDELEKEFIMENLLFTIIACFDLEDKFVVKLFGDGYVFTKNLRGNLSFMKFSYGKYPPYYAYKYCNIEEYKDYEFKTFVFNKDTFSNVGIGSDGIMPMVKGEIPQIDNFILNANELAISASIRANKQNFFDDVTIGMFDNKKGGSDGTT